MTSTPDIHALTGPYVLDAVNDLERAGFEQHLAGCTDCDTEVADLREAVTKLSVYVATQPPAALRSRVMTAAGQVRQLPPAPRPGIDSPRRARPRVLRRSVTLAAAFLAIAASGGVALDQYRDNAATTALSTRAATILAEPDTRTVHGAVSGGGQATVVLSVRQDAAVVLVRDLKPLASRMTYQLWLIDGAQNARSIGLTDGKSLRPAVVTGGVTSGVAFGVTVEPRGGSSRPTLPSRGGLQPVLPLGTPTA
ncbi:anti-sigma factor [Kribbella sp. CA-293567]|uniref:anti-sigma factor n=1 Tax=Kribbella sp. CA-293567 TaxID=3002436 RepID=UPI0022DD2FDB|nr:anti-sigma factor [Kribbella sp. CA-293567]WBQ03875.1 anti-sigma factor [Kribbella sp. CA-293567]